MKKVLLVLLCALLCGCGTVIQSAPTVIKPVPVPSEYLDNFKDCATEEIKTYSDAILFLQRLAEYVKKYQDQNDGLRVWLKKQHINE